MSNKETIPKLCVDTLINTLLKFRELNIEYVDLIHDFGFHQRTIHIVEHVKEGATPIIGHYSNIDISEEQDNYINKILNEDGHV